MADIHEYDRLEKLNAIAHRGGPTTVQLSDTSNHRSRTGSAAGRRLFLRQHLFPAPAIRSPHPHMHILSPCFRRPLTRAHSAALVLITSLAFSACGGSDPAGPAEEGASQVTAVINGTAWNATQVSENRQANRYAFTADDIEWRVVIRVNEFAGAGTYPLSATPDVNIQVVRFDATGVWGGVSAGGSGSIVITTFNPTRAVGTFSGTLPASAGSATQTPLTISNGTFDIVLEN
jgi:hypothetical protein